MTGNVFKKLTDASSLSVWHYQTERSSGACGPVSPGNTHLDGVTAPASPQNDPGWVLDRKKQYLRPERCSQRLRVYSTGRGGGRGIGEEGEAQRQEERDRESDQRERGQGDSDRQTVKVEGQTGGSRRGRLENRGRPWGVSHSHLPSLPTPPATEGQTRPDQRPTSGAGPLPTCQPPPAQLPGAQGCAKWVSL